MAAAFWPTHVENNGPWQRLADLSTNKPKADTTAGTCHLPKLSASPWMCGLYSLERSSCIAILE